MAKLTRKQEAFVAEYLIDLDGTKAAARAGYKGKYLHQIAGQVMRKPHVKKLIDEALDERMTRTKITQDYVLEVIQETIERCRQIEPVLDRKGNQVYVENREGKEVPAFTFEHTGVLKGAELLGKHLKMFTDKVDLSNDDGSLKPQAPQYVIVKE
jgi:phage terminase small subunit